MLMGSRTSFIARAAVFLVIPLATAGLFVVYSHRGSQLDYITRVASTDLDLGTVNGGGDIEAFAEATNPSSEAINITSVSTDCRCTVAGNSPPTIAAHGTCRIPVTINTRGFPNGSFHKRLVLQLADLHGAQRPLVFTLHGLINHRFQLASLTSKLDFSAVSRGSVSPPIALYLSGPQSLIESLPTSIEVSDDQPPSIEVKYNGTSTNIEARSVMVTLRTRTNTPLGAFQSSLHVNVRGHPAETASIPISARVTNGLFAWPDALLIPCYATGVASARVSLRTVGRSKMSRDDVQIASDIPISTHALSNNDGGIDLVVTYAGLPNTPITGSITITASPTGMLRLPVILLPMRAN